MRLVNRVLSTWGGEEEGRRRYYTRSIELGAVGSDHIVFVFDMLNVSQGKYETKEEASTADAFHASALRGQTIIRRRKQIK